MARYLGIDFGSKKIGLALSDEGGTMAFPLHVMKVGPGLAGSVALLAQEHGAEAIVMGESRNYQQQENPIMRKANIFKREIEETSGLPVYLEEEYLSSKQAEREQGKSEHIDASAAAIILQSFLDRVNQQPTTNN